MHNSKWKKKRTVIIGPRASEIKKRIENFWGRKIFDQQNPRRIDLGLQCGISQLAVAMRRNQEVRHMAKKRVADVLVDTLVAAGVKRVYDWLEIR